VIRQSPEIEFLYRNPVCLLCEWDVCTKSPPELIGLHLALITSKAKSVQFIIICYVIGRIGRRGTLFDTVRNPWAGCLSNLRREFVHGETPLGSRRNHVYEAFDYYSTSLAVARAYEPLPPLN
jgi:hypothetical protein